MTVNRWGVWEVHFPFAMNSRENARMNLQAILPRLKPKMGAMAASVRAVDSMNRHRARIEPSSAVRLATTPLCASSPSESQCDVH